jgi:hypothetical protein
MAKVDVIKTSFTGGQFGPSLLGRTDIAQYENACYEVQNMLVRPYGPIISTPGTRYVAECKFSALGTQSAVRLLEFVFNQSDAYIIEMGEYYFRFYTNRGVVVTSGTTPFELAHPYSAAEIRDVQYTQLNDLMWLAHKSHRPQLLTRVSANKWTLADYDFLGGPFLDDNTDEGITLTASATAGTLVTITLSATSSTLSFVASGATMGHQGTYWKLGGVVTTDTTALQGYVKITSVSSATVALVTVMETLSLTSSTIFAEGAWSSVRGWPARVQFHEGRLYWARTDKEPQKVWGSHSFVYDQYALDEQADDEGINIELSSNQSNEIQWLASGNSLLAGTYGGAFIINGGGDAGITPTNISAKQEVNFGTEAIQPRRIGAYYYYVQRFRQKVRELFYMWENNAYRATDKTILSPEITGDGIVDMAYQEVPETILWCVTTDGTIATMTREIDQEVQGWAIQNTTGRYESVAVMPSQSYKLDEVWVVVQRIVNGSTKRFIEYFENIILPERQDRMVYLHSSLEFDAYALTDSSHSNCTISLSATAGTSVVLTCSSNYFTVSDETMRIRAINSLGSTIGEFYVTSYSSAKVVTGTVRYTFSASTIAAGYWGKSVDKITGMSHLNLETVKVLADGGVDKPDKVVTGGTVSLAYNYFVVQCGLPYTQKVATLPFESGSQRGTAQGKIQRINQVMFKLNRSYRGFSVGGTEALAERVSYREPNTLLGTPELLFTGILSNINFKDDYRYGAQIYVVNDEPFPVEILSIMAMLDTQDKG